MCGQGRGGGGPADGRGTAGFRVLSAPYARISIDGRDNTFVKLRTGDKAIIIGAAAIAWYERAVVDDADLISSRVAAYRQRAPWSTTMIVLVTALHLLEAIDPRFDPYHRAVVWFRRSVPPLPQPDAEHH